MEFKRAPLSAMSTDNGPKPKITAPSLSEIAKAPVQGTVLESTLALSFGFTAVNENDISPLRNASVDTEPCHDNIALLSPSVSANIKQGPILSAPRARYPSAASICTRNTKSICTRKIINQLHQLHKLTMRCTRWMTRITCLSPSL